MKLKITIGVSRFLLSVFVLHFEETAGRRQWAGDSGQKAVGRRQRAEGSGYKKEINNYEILCCILK